MPGAASLRRGDLVTLLAASVLTILVSLVAATGSGVLTVATLLGFTLFLATIVCFITAPQLAVALTIPLFALLPTAKTLWFPQAGPLKDVITIAAAIAAAVLVAIRASQGETRWANRRLVLLAAILLGLYLTNLGAGFAPGAYDAAWFHGVRLVAEPVVLLFVGLAIGGPRTLRWAVISLVVTGVAVAAYGVAQQWIGMWNLVGMGYSFEHEVRTIGTRLRSFGTLDEPFAYAAFLLFPLAAVLFMLRRSVWTVAAATVLVAGLGVSLVRSAIAIAVVVFAIAVARKSNFTVAGFVLASALAVAFAFLVTSTGATRSETVRAGPSLYLTVNGRTEVWSTVLGDPASWPAGRGVGEVGVAAERAGFKLTRDDSGNDESAAVDSAYFATIADIGIIGLAVRLAMFALLLHLAVGAARRGSSPGWLAVTFLTIMMIDGVTRDSFTGFPTAFLGMLLVGVCLRTVADEHPQET